MNPPGVDLVWNPAGATDLVLLAHGGMEESRADAYLWRAPILRMWPFAAAARTAVPDAAVGLMRYRYQGWNATTTDPTTTDPAAADPAAADPAVDLRAVLDELPPVIRRVVLIGHSMGGRAVVAAGDHPRVAGVLALAPWLPEGEPLTKLRSPVTFAHGTDDTITDPRTTTAYANRLRAAGTPVTVYAVTDETHPLLHRATDWNTLVATFTAGALASPQPTPATTSSEQTPATTTSEQTPATTTSESTTAPDADTEPLPQYGQRSSLPAAVGSIAVARLRLPVVERFQVKVAEARG
ncbi:alpha/beta fold hydrolase [Kribbella sp. NBC_00709]|uniref:dienelactone hydrolase family protein n=1 Tax=Kribbella sp. NBC_00709 TaxID=2975972 RepID=UPI002E29C7F7|nr:alpha/beta fold hydrolase [Kribbella sp. NBC_00709]